MAMPLPYFVTSHMSAGQCTSLCMQMAFHFMWSFVAQEMARQALISRPSTFGFSERRFTYSNKQCLSCWWQLNYFISERFDKWFSTFWFLRILTTLQKHKLILYVTCLIYLRCTCYVARAMRSELKDRVIHSIFMIIKLLHHVITSEKCSEICSMQNSQTFVASPSGLWFIQIVGAISWWLHWNHEDWDHFLCRESELPPVPFPRAVCLCSLHSWMLDMWVAQRGCRAAAVQ